MFSMFGRTGPHKRSGEFFACLNTEKMGNPRVNNESNEHKKVASFSGELTSDTRGRTDPGTAMTRKRSPVFFEVKGPHVFFLNRPP